MNGTARPLGFALTAALPVAGEVAFRASDVVLGRGVIRHYRSPLDPRRIFGRGRR